MRGGKAEKDGRQTEHGQKVPVVPSVLRSQSTGRVDQRCCDQFDMFDLDKSGELTTEDIHEMIRQRAAKLAAAAVGP